MKNQFRLIGIIFVYTIITASLGLNFYLWNKNKNQGETIQDFDKEREKLESDVEFWQTKTKKVTAKSYQFSSFSDGFDELKSTEDGKSYWFVLWMDKKGSAYYNETLEMPFPYFDMEYFYKKNGKNNFILSFSRISKATFEVNEDE